MASERTQILTPLFSQTVWEGKIEREKEGERKEGIFRKRVSNLSLNFPAIGPSNSGKTRSKVALRCKGYAWAPVLCEFQQLREVGVFSYLVYFRFKSHVNDFINMRP